MTSTLSIVQTSALLDNIKTTRDAEEKLACMIRHGTDQKNCTANSSYDDDEDRHGCDMVGEADVVWIG